MSKCKHDVFLPAGAHTARERLVLRLLYVLLYVFRVCLFVGNEAVATIRVSSGDYN